MKTVRVIAALLAATACLGTAPPPTFRDLDHNGRLDPYEDRRLPVEARVRDLLARMTLAEKVGTVLHGSLPGQGNPFGTSAKGYDLAGVRALVLGRGVTSAITRLAMPPAALAEQNNAVQRIAAEGRLGIPVTISSDPRNHFSAVSGAGVAANGFTQWPEPLGLAALRDPALVRRFARAAAREYRAAGIGMALSPQADLATEPRWPRLAATFGSDPALVSSLAGAYVEGFQGGPDGLAPGGVAAVLKHWVGYGAEPNGFDAHNAYGRTVRLNDAAFARHLAAFAGPLRAHPAGVMPTYAIVAGPRVAGRPLEPVGAGFSRQLIDGLLRGRFGYRGLVVSDWGIVNDCPRACEAPTAAAPQTVRDIGMPWGVEALSMEQRFAKAMNAGVDQFGGAADPAPLLAAVRHGLIAPARLDEAVARVLRLKFELGLFDDPFVDPAVARRLVADPAPAQEAAATQRAAQVLLENHGHLLPLRTPGLRLWTYGITPAAVRAASFVPVQRPEDAQAALIRLPAPSEPLHPFHFFAAMQHEGRLDYRDDDPGLAALRRVPAGVPAIVAVDLDRAAILTPLRDRAAALIALFGADDAALLDVIAGRATPRGRLPLDLPSSAATVARQNPAQPDGAVAPLYRAGRGLPF